MWHGVMVMRINFSEDVVTGWLYAVHAGRLSGSQTAGQDGDVKKGAPGSPGTPFLSELCLFLRMICLFNFP